MPRPSVLTTKTWRGAMTPPRFHLVSLGCAKNTVDSESMAALLARDGFQPEAQAGGGALGARVFQAGAPAAPAVFPHLHPRRLPPPGGRGVEKAAGFDEENIGT